MDKEDIKFVFQILENNRHFDPCFLPLGGGNAPFHCLPAASKKRKKRRKNNEYFFFVSYQYIHSKKIEVAYIIEWGTINQYQSKTKPNQSI